MRHYSLRRQALVLHCVQTDWRTRVVYIRWERYVFGVFRRLYVQI